ncbi:hypothetical protein GOBAR_DD07087 [Gossypium barbadense]|nr:hypothetical protein GOBAR_DD07087 [Gossypium barbadense]
MPDDSNRSHEAREESHASLMDNTGDEFVPSIDDFDILMAYPTCFATIYCSAGDSDREISQMCRRFREGLHIDIHTYLATDPPKVFSELARQAKVVESVLRMRLSSSDESTIQSKRASDTASPS